MRGIFEIHSVTESRRDGMVIEKCVNKKIKSRRDDIFYDYAAPAELE
jgi:hypothetical protein